MQISIKNTNQNLNKEKFIEAKKLVYKWFQSKGWNPFNFQEEVWNYYNKYYNGLIHAPTGIGKTYAIWFGFIINYLQKFYNSSNLIQKNIKLLWITPLRALSEDTKISLEETINDLNLNLRIEIRTGDTPVHQRKKQLINLPDVLITTPESISILFTYHNYENIFSNIECVVVDELHEMIGSKRGTMLELILARLKSLNKKILIWGLSATIGNIDIAKKFLLGNFPKKFKIIKGNFDKKIIIKSLYPDEIERFPKAGHLGIKMLPKVVEEIEKDGSIIIFTNTRSQAEIWFREIIDYYPISAGYTAIHHSSIDKEKRIFVEKLLKNGNLKCVVCTSSLDLGVDFSPVDKVMQIGSVKGIARMLQRAGRSGHQPGKSSILYFVPTNSFELIEIAAAKKALEDNFIEERIPIEKPYDVLAQHLITLAIGNGFEKESMYKEIVNSYSYRNLTIEEFEWIINFINNGGNSLSQYPDFRKVKKIDNIYRVTDKNIIRRHRLSIGTITSDSLLNVKYQNGGFIGTIEEYFVSKLKEGDIFTFAGKNLEFIRIKDFNVIVRNSNKESKGIIPSWIGGRMPLSTHLSKKVREILSEIKNEQLKYEELEIIHPLIKIQKEWSIIPDENEILIERLKDSQGFHIFIYPFEGFMAHEGLSSLIAYRISKHESITINYAVNDYGFELKSNKFIEIEKFIKNGLFSEDNLENDINNSVNYVELAKRQFRDIARISGLVINGFPGKEKSLKQLQSSSSLFFEVFRKYDPDNLLLKQTYFEVLNNQLEIKRIKNILKRINNSKVVIKEIKYPTPFSFPIMYNRMRSNLSSEKLSIRVNKILSKLEKLADK